MEANTLFPVFLKAEELQILIVGGGKVGTEKLYFLLKSSPQALVTILSESFSGEMDDLIREAGALYVRKIRKTFEPTDVLGFHLVIAATGEETVNEDIMEACHAHQVLINVADDPGKCDFYLGSIVTRGNLKIGISTNGKSPTLAKRMREFLEDLLPEEIDELALHLHHYRNSLVCDFHDKVHNLNQLTKALLR
ncbi:MAG: bifunctional precorrin-2 dehydrogenase/sirohydrochlorin ferrochelatase [Lewinellaceae bacterium]|nr:bifunctional precorrin-2 dehydrogenase/sirohydrochlorin ferrochelatase [Lewinellaceae bacterium]HQU54743.1 bifunctional precorrin-2 dehydrogenase/sirohydrochlorin ferrochelatase [Saprospiraceae bacterium]